MKLPRRSGGATLTAASVWPNSPCSESQDKRHRARPTLPKRIEGRRTATFRTLCCLSKHTLAAHSFGSTLVYWDLISTTHANLNFHHTPAMSSHLPAACCVDESWQCWHTAWSGSETSLRLSQLSRCVMKQTFRAQR